jgi:hypothetical protein
MKWAGHEARLDKRNAYRVLVGKPEEKRPLERPRRRWLNNIVTRFAARLRDNNNVGSSDLTRKFIGTIAEITHNRHYTQFRV